MLTDERLEQIQKDIKLMAGNIGSSSQFLLDDVLQLKAETAQLKKDLEQARNLCGVYAKYFEFHEEVRNLRLPWEIKA